jgi:hypothetical protein
LLQKKVDDGRRRTVAKIVLAKTNLHEKVKKKILDFVAMEVA